MAKNRLALIRKDLNIGIRDIEDKTNVANSVVSLLENERRKFRQEHLDVICELLQVSHDYLLGNSDLGIFIYDKDNNKYAISEKEYLEMRKDIEIIYEKYPTTVDIPENNVRYLAKGFYKRLIKYEYISNYTNILKNNIIRLLDRLNKKDLQKTYDFINHFILK